VWSPSSLDAVPVACPGFSHTRTTAMSSGAEPARHDPLDVPAPDLRRAYAYGRTGAALGFDRQPLGGRSSPGPGGMAGSDPGSHEGYVSWERAEAGRTMVSDRVPTGRHHRALRHGDAPLAGLVRCRRLCGSLFGS
jgi:hypothetical protein